MNTIKNAIPSQDGEMVLDTRFARMPLLGRKCLCFHAAIAKRNDNTTDTIMGTNHKSHSSC